jgi:hypothetical protein
MLLKRFPARSWDELRIYNGLEHPTFQEAARQRGLLSTRHQDAVICIQDGIDLQRPPSDIRFLLEQMVRYGAERRDLEIQFAEYLGDARIDQ